MVGLAQGALDNVIPYIKERSQFNQKLWDFQVGLFSMVFAMIAGLQIDHVIGKSDRSIDVLVE